MFRGVKGGKCKRRRGVAAGLRMRGLDLREADSGQLGIREDGKTGQGTYATQERQAGVQGLWV